MKVDILTTDEKGWVVINGVRVRIKENVCHKHYREAVKNYRKVYIISTVGILIVLLGILLFTGLVGHSELLSLLKEEDTWTLKSYILYNTVSVCILLIGFLIAKWALAKESIYKSWIFKYYEQYGVDKEVTEK